MMRNLTPMNSKEAKELIKQFKEQWGFEGELDYQFLLSSKDKIWIVDRSVANIDLEKLRISTIGVYIAELEKGGVRLSIEGSQLIGPKSKKNIVEFSKEQARSWLKGNDIEWKESFKGFAIIRSGKDYLGTGKFKEGTILNFVPKTRRILAPD
jgi:NOL1/NOP2/fmu family ribosome biogenesis protein